MMQSSISSSGGEQDLNLRFPILRGIGGLPSYPTATLLSSVRCSILVSQQHLRYSWDGRENTKEGYTYIRISTIKARKGRIYKTTMS